MEYRYNAEQDRLKRHAYNPSFFKAIYIGPHTEREALLWACTSNVRQQQTIAEKFAKEDETVEDISMVPKRMFETWLLGGKNSITIYDQVIPADYAVKFFISEDQPGAEANARKGKYGDLEEYRQALINQDESVLRKLYASFMASRPEADVVRVMEAVSQENHPGYEQYKKEIAMKDAQDDAKHVASMQKPNVEPASEPGCGCSMDNYEDYDER